MCYQAEGFNHIRRYHGSHRQVDFHSRRRARAKPENTRIPEVVTRPDDQVNEALTSLLLAMSQSLGHIDRRCHQENAADPLNNSYFGSTETDLSLERPRRSQ
jgi:hypothetical protein